jgi:predicted esterase
MAYRKRRICLGILLTVTGIMSAQSCSKQERSEDSSMNMSIVTQIPAPAGSEDGQESLPEELFAYDTSVPFNVQELSEEEAPGGITIREITYDAYDQSINTEGKIGAYVVMPEGEGPFPCVLYFHWLGSSNANKEEFLEEAKTLAGQGIAGVLIDGYFPWKMQPSELKKDKELVIYQVIETRRAVDYLESLPGVDTKRLGYVGHDYGAMFGSVMCSFDKRISNYVFITGMGNFTDWFLQYWRHTDDNGVNLSKDGKDRYRIEMSELDPVNYVREAAPAKLFFQFADNDVFITKEIAEEYYDAASEPKEVKFYEAEHEMESEQARLNRIEWLINNLK